VYKENSLSAGARQRKPPPTTVVGLQSSSLGFRPTLHNIFLSLLTKNLLAFPPHHHLPLFSPDKNNLSHHLASTFLCAQNPMSVALFSSFQYILLLILLPQTTPFVNVLPTQQEFPSLSPETAVDMLKLYDSNIQSSSDYKSPSSLLNTIISSHPSHPLSFLVDLKTRSWSKDFRDVCRTALSPPTAGIEPIVTLGICAGCPSEALRTLQGWVAGLNLSKGLVMELDRDGILIGDDDEVR